MFVNLKNYVIGIYYFHITKIDNIDNDFWGEIYLSDIEESDKNV